MCIVKCSRSTVSARQPQPAIATPTVNGKRATATEQPALATMSSVRSNCKPLRQLRGCEQRQVGADCVRVGPRSSSRRVDESNYQLLHLFAYLLDR
jgi:hypothetical protein